MVVQWIASSFSLSLTAPITSYINQDLGPKPYYFWMATIWPLTFSATVTICGRFEDIFGRRYIMIFGNILGIVACIIGGTATSIGVVILAIGLNGVASAIQQTASACVSELAPRKYRPQVASSVVGAAIVGGAFGNPIAIHLATHLTWRWGFWITLLVDGISALALFFFYFPPTFQEIHRADRRSKLEEFKKIDYVGVVLFAGGITILLVGISWGGASYPWKSVGVILPIVLGGLTLIVFGFWEVYAPLAEPIVPYRLLKNVRGFTMVLVVEFVEGMLLYSLIALYPVQIEVIYAPTNSNKAGWESSTVLMGLYLGVLLLGFTISKIGHARWIFVASVILSTIFIGCMAAMTLDSLGAVLALTTLTGFAIGFIQITGTVMILLNCPDRDLGAAFGLNGTFRTSGGSVATAIYSTILSNRVKDVLPGLVSKATLPLGLPVTSLKPLLLALAAGGSASAAKIPGVTATVLAAAGQAYKEAYVKGFRLVYLVAIAFGVLVTICALFTKNIDHLLTDHVAAKLHKGVLGQHDDGHNHNHDHDHDHDTGGVVDQEAGRKADLD
ncbi:hypothetical protein A1O3_02215 [Capronia epimyces CBS 606.96]|uniref:Major facilitator superfamily (MFS) profile domain-containing protein n=1 Tax=Capronia epimyces CBS 606.96 TaxID=1182542 RepID=W9YIR7_9EURO|nr:uncharacterized protein A1O3_02215 [Capronia epimyces CBS 606.96]EXJ89151.1 hypothetical protein A1O3_02215 [Capronia epimyces CBS 606.96]